MKEKKEIHCFPYSVFNNGIVNFFVVASFILKLNTNLYTLYTDSALEQTCTNVAIERPKYAEKVVFSKDKDNTNFHNWCCLCPQKLLVSSQKSFVSLQRSKQ